MDIKKLRSDIHSSLRSDPITSAQLDSPSPHWSIDSKGFLLNNKIYIPNTSNLRLQILQYKHDHPISGHFGQNRTIDRLTKQSIFILTIDTIMSPMLAKLFVLHVFSKHGVPSHITSDHGTEFISAFFRSLSKVLDMKLHFTLGYHPESDGQTECANQTLEQYLRVYCNYQQSNWSDLLPIAEFAYNNAPNATTGLSPFYANKGYHPNLSIHPE